jgi:hypothetical protein
VLALTVLIVCALSGELAAVLVDGAPGVAKMMMYEGYITDDSGLPLPDGPYDFRFSLYESPEGGAPVWAEEHLAVEVVDGVVQVRLGEGTPPAPLDIPFDAQYYLGVQLGDDPEMVPRLQLMTTAYAFRARVADEVPDGSITSEKLTPLSVTDEHIASVSWAKITDAPENSGTPPGGGGPVPARVWHTRGNRNTDPERNYVGTAEVVDLILATNGEERLRIAGDGSSITIKADTLAAKYILSRVSPTEGAFFLADPRHGLKRTGNDDVRLYTTGGNLLLEGGNVGIGTAAPAAKLHIVSTALGSDSDIASYPVLLETGAQGMAIRVNTSGADATNNYVSFVSFWDSDQMKGRIEGQDAVDLLSSPQYIYFTLIDGIELGVSTVTLIGDIADVRFCVGFGAVTCPPGWSTVAASAANLAIQAARAVGTQVFLWSDLGVAYESSSGDYAEWLERLDPAEVLEPGDIVGVFGGKVTRNTTGAQQVMVVSHAPIVLGNMPPEGREHLHSKVAFMGQVPVKISGRVRPGDYVIPSGLGDGVGIAVPPELMTAEEYVKAVGRSWGESAGEPGATVRLAVGLNQGDVAEAVLRQQSAYDALRTELAAKGSAVLELQIEVAELRAGVRGLAALQQEVQALRGAVTGSVELSAVNAVEREEATASGGSW